MSPSFTLSIAGRSIHNSRIIGWLMTLAALLFLQACSAVKLAYNNAPEFSYWWLDAYVDFQSDQSPRARDELTRLLAWHRAEELPKIASLLQKTQRLALTDLTPAQVCAMVDETRERINAVIRQVEAPALWLATGLSADQLKHVDAKLNKNNEAYEREWASLTLQERFDKRLKANVERAEEFYGRLDDRQVAVLRSALEASHYDPAQGLAERKRRQGDLLKTLRVVSGNATSGTSTRPAQGDALALLRGYRDRVNQSPNAAYQAYSDKLTQESCATLATLHNSTNAEQRKRALARLGAYERDARELISQR
jgi:Family of unknown function (DUF6279)